MPDSVGVQRALDPNDSGSSPGPAHPFSLLKPIAEAAAILLGLAFVTGWTYLVSYYTAFGLNPLELDIPATVISALAVHVLIDSFWPLIPVGLFAVYLSWAAADTRKRRSQWAGAAVAVLGIVLVAIALWIGRASARQDLFEVGSKLPTVGFTSTLKEKPPACLVDGDLECKLLLHSKGVYYFFEPIRPNAEPILAGAESNIHVYAVPDSQILKVHIQRGFK